MKVLFVRHGESVDDLTDQYGGWGDFPMTPKGKIQLKKTAEKIAELGVKFEKVLTSPLMRAQESARIIANKLSIPVEEFLYVKEKNGYGLLSGMNKQEAKEKYPEIVEMMENGYAFGAEPDEKFTDRVKASIERMKEMGAENLIVVTHGGYTGRLVDVVLGKKYIKAHDGGFVLVEFKGEEIEIIEVDGVDFE